MTDHSLFMQAGATLDRKRLFAGTDGATAGELLREYSIDKDEFANVYLNVEAWLARGGARPLGSRQSETFAAGLALGVEYGKLLA